MSTTLRESLLLLEAKLDEQFDIRIDSGKVRFKVQRACKSL